MPEPHFADNHQTHGFGAPPSSDYLKFWLGGFFSPSKEIELKDGRLTTAEFGAGVLRRNEHVLNPTAEQWETFWRAVDAVDVWNWHAEYKNDDVLDGTQWELEIKRGNRSVKCDGSNSFPIAGNSPGFDLTPESPFVQFLLALQALTGVQYYEPEDEE